MAKNTKRQNNLPGVLALQRCLNITDGLMHSLVATQDGVQEYPVNVMRHGIRGVLGSEEASTNSEREGLSNPQTTESAKLHPKAIGLKVTFSIRPIPLSDGLFACSDLEFKKNVQKLTNELADSESLREVCQRYAHNILRGSWMWRNRVLGRPNVSVGIPNHDQPITADGLRNNDFSPHPSTKLLGNYLLDCFSGVAGDAPVINVTGTISGDGLGGMEVYPSQNMLTASQKPKGFARSLYKVNPLSPRELSTLARNNTEQGIADVIIVGHAALRDQKIGNAIRTIDTWYTQDEQDAPAIAIEPNGASMSDNVFYRGKGSNAGNAYSMLSDITTLLEVAKKAKTEHSSNPRLMYIAGMLVRGGVLSGQTDKGATDGE